jgi:hypothetical protein
LAYNQGNTMGNSVEGAWRQALLDAADYLESHEWI